MRTPQVALAAAAMALAVGARAQEVGTHAGEPAIPPRGQTLELKLGSFTPLIDREAALNGKTPYADTFGTPMLLGEVEIDRYFYQGIGAAGAALSVGYAEKYGRASVLDPTTRLVVGPSEEATALFVVPIRLSGVYRFDWAALHYNVPLVPYVKAGIIYEPWWGTKGGQIEYVNGRRAVGGRWGYGGTAGLSLMLDWFEPRLARDFYADLGVVHTYVFGEYTLAEVNSFGAAGLVLSSRHFMFGVSLDF